MILRLGGDKSVFQEKFGEKINIIKETFATKELFEDVLVNEPQLKAMIVVPTQIGTLNQIEIRARLSRFVRAGGTVIIAFLFLVEHSDWELNPLFWDMKRQWTVDSSAHRHARLKLSLNAAMKGKLGSAANELHQAYETEAVKIMGVLQSEMVYIDNKSSVSGDPAQDCYVGCPSAFARVGSGYLGYIGDLRVDSGTVSLMMAMLSKSQKPPHQLDFTDSRYSSSLWHSTSQHTSYIIGRSTHRRFPDTSRSPSLEQFQPRPKPTQQDDSVFRVPFG